MAEIASKYEAAYSTSKPASVGGRAVVGAIIGGPAGAVVGALSAINKNIKK